MQVARDRNGGTQTQFYTTLPNRETAEKLAALAAAGNANSQLIGRLRKHHQQENSNILNLPQSDQPMPPNHKEEQDVEESINNEKYERQRVEHRRKPYRRQKTEDESDNSEEVIVNF